MPNFRYKGRDARGSLVTGTLRAASAEAVAEELFGGSITPIEIAHEDRGPRSGRQEGGRDASSGLRERLGGLLPGNRVDITDLIIFSRQMYSLSKAGMPLDRALHGLEASIERPAMKKVLKDLVVQLEKGLDLGGAMGRHPRVFSPLYLSLVHVGENTGRLDLAFEQVGRYLELERHTRKQVRSATRYPLFVLLTIAAALAVITVFVIPVFAETFVRMQAELPWQTKALIGVSDFMVASWHYLLAGAALAWFGFRQYVKTERGGRNWDRRKLKMPLVGKILERIALARFSRTFAAMMKAGVPIVQSLGVIARAVGNRYIGDQVVQMREGISHGESLHQAALKTRMFSPLVLQMIAVGEESGNMDELLEEVADFYDAEVEYDLKKLSSAIEPILIVFIAGLVLILALGVFLPIWDLANAAR